MIAGWFRLMTTAAQYDRFDGYVRVPTPCPECDGHGWFTECTVGSNGRDEDIDWPCQSCDQTGVVQ